MDTFEQARTFFFDGIRHYEAGRYDLAEAQFQASLALVPQRASTLTNLGATWIKLGRFADAAVVLEDATRIDPADAQGWGHLANAWAELAKPADALRCAEEALRLDPGIAMVWTLRGTLLRDAGRPDEAAQCFREALSHGGDQELNAYFLAALAGGQTPAATPQRYVQALFDGYAQDFDKHLVGVLQYRAPQLLVRGLADRQFAHVLDLGCGTGLAGEQLRGRAARITAVDLSANMVAQARSRHVYDEVVQAEAIEYARTAKPESFDLVMAADVFSYIGDLREMFSEVNRLLRVRGVFCFTVELADAEHDVVLRPSLRYAHSRAHVEALAHTSGFQITLIEEHTLREEQRTPIAGLFVWLAKP